MLVSFLFYSMVPRSILSSILMDSEKQRFYIKKFFFFAQTQAMLLQHIERFLLKPISLSKGLSTLCIYK
ncbi:hypothetical protein FGO68_gene15361 [Halteria grandinella]|uniref:Uncharacterized protein n=1 Tax=Halteria grandinella TaxID=5974 RepID=A0A8J8T934_HALGN|nr:hypothetical protein FGO68_gene15361 [Halteria grandinella]